DLRGSTTDDTNGIIYLFLYNIFNSLIVKYVQATDTASILLQESQVTGGLGWNPNTFVSAGVSGDLLMWTDPIPRYINLTYPLTTYTQANLSQVTEPFVIPLLPTRATDSAVTGNIQTIPLQFTYRWTTQDGFQSVLAPYSKTILPVRESELAVDANFGNVVDIVVHIGQKIPLNWQSVDFVVRFFNSNTFFVIRSW